MMESVEHFESSTCSKRKENASDLVFDDLSSQYVSKTEDTMKYK